MTGGRARAPGPVEEAGAAGWTHFAHGADIGVRGHGASPAQAFEQAALALTAVVTEPANVRQVTSVAIRCRAPDLDLLLYEWLNSLVFHMATRHLLFAGFSVRLAGSELEAEACGILIRSPSLRGVAEEAPGASSV